MKRQWPGWNPYPMYIPHPRVPPVVRPPIRSHEGNSPAYTAHQYASDNFEIYNDFVSFDVTPEESFEPQAQSQQIFVPEPAKKKQKFLLKVVKEDSAGSQKNPVAMINELHMDAKWTLLEEKITKFTTSFKIELIVNSSKFIGEGRTKKSAKIAAAQQALFKLYDITPINCSGDLPKSIIIKHEENYLLDQDLANRIGHAVLYKAKTVFEKMQDLKKWTVLASIVLTNVEKPEWLDIVCVTTGTKCVKGDNLSMLGSIIGDCHAEVLARRCFLLHLYQQICDYQLSKDSKELIVEPCPESKGFRLKENIKVHLYISTAPCGDARVFSPKEEAVGDSHPNRLSRGVLRAKIENGEGTIPVKRENATLTWDGILQGNQRLQFMSCSDKVCLWNVVGLQGALLSHFLEPIYVESVILGNLFSYDHLMRAIRGRLNLNFESDSLKEIPQPFRINAAKVAKAAMSDTETYRQPSKAPNYALNWLKNDFIPEIICTDTGKVRETNQQSRLCKRNMFYHFVDLINREVQPLESSQLKMNAIPTIYRDGKTSAHLYQETKTRAIKAFTEQSLGTWIQVPIEIDLFNLTI